MGPEKQIDEGWKEKAFSEKAGQDEQRPQGGDEVSPQKPEEAAASADQGDENVEVDFLNYVTSLGFQTMIFLGMIPNPMTNQTEKNLKQAKFLIDTLAMLKDKTAGNLEKKEEDLLSASLYELQMKYVELSQAEHSA